MAFSLSSAGQYLVFVGSDPFLGSMGLFRKNLFSTFRGFDLYRRRDGSVLEGTICKQFVMSVKKRKNLKPCRGFKSFRSLAFRIQFMKNRISVVRILRLEEKSKMDLWKSEKSQARKKQRNLSKSPLFLRLGAIFSVGG